MWVDGCMLISLEMLACSTQPTHLTNTHPIISTHLIEQYMRQNKANYTVKSLINLCVEGYCIAVCEANLCRLEIILRPTRLLDCR